MRGCWRVLNSCQRTELRVSVFSKRTFRGLKKGVRFERFELFIGKGFGKRKKKKWNLAILTFGCTILAVDCIEILLKMYILHSAHTSYTT